MPRMIRRERRTRSRVRNSLPFAALLAASAAAVADPLPIEYFTREDDIGLVKISPDGEYLAATASGAELSGLIFFELGSPGIKGGLRARQGDEIIDFDWISTTRVIYSYGERYGGQEYVSNTGEIFAVDRDGTRNTILYGYRAGDKRTGSRLGTRDSTYARGELLNVLENDDDEILILERPYELRGNTYYLDRDAYARIALLDVYTGDSDQRGFVPLKLANVIVDANEEVRFAVGYDNQSDFSVIWKPEVDAEWTQFELSGFRENTVIPRRFTADGSGVYFTGVEVGESLDALYRLDLATRQMERLYQHPYAEIGTVVTDLADTYVIGVRVQSDRLEYHWVDAEDPAARLYRMLQRAFSGKAVEITSVTADGKLAVVFVYSDTNPGDYYLFNVDDKHAEYLRPTRSWVDPRLMRPKEPVTLAARDGLQLHGYLTRPRDGEGPFPLVVLPHGGPHGVRDRWEFDWEVQLLANRGYAVLQVNYRGSGGYGVDFRQAGYGEWGAAMQDDVTDATRWAVEQGITEANSICIYGASYGAYAALMGAVREPDLYRCAIGLAGVYDLQLMFEAGDVQRWEVGQAFLQRYLGENPELLRKRSPVYNAERIQAPVMLIHGKDDWRADFEHAERMREALEDAGKTVEWVELGGEGHGIYNPETRREVYGELLAFLEHYLPLDSVGETTVSAQTGAPPPAQAPSRP
jgi:dipeptidyl aminopeptidase/acylaminoacyl peptidase